MKFLYRHAHFLNKTTRQILCSTLIQSHIDYACMSWFYGISSSLKSKLQILQNKMVRFIDNIGPRYHLNLQEFHDIGYLHIENRVSQLALNTAHGIFYGKCPSYLNQFFVTVRDAHHYNTRSRNYNFVVPSINNITLKKCN